MDRYLLWVQIEPSTLAVRRRALYWAFEGRMDFPLSSLSAVMLEELFLARRATASGHWVNTAGSAIRSLIKWAVGREVMERDISRFWPKVRAISQRSTEPITPEELEKLLVTASSDLRLFMLLGVFFGARRQNLCDLDWSWISKDWIVTIPAGKFKQRREHVEPLHPRLIEELKGRRQESGLVMPDLPSPCNIGEAMKAAARRCGVDPKKVYPHALRATFASRLSDSGANLKQIAEMGGWSSVEVVASRYIRKMDPATARSILGRM